MITDYASLKASIASWTHRDDLGDVMDEFIAGAESRMASELRVRELETTASGTLSGITLALPADFAALRRLTIASTTKYSPEYIGVDGMRSKYIQGNSMPSFYTLIGGNIEFNCTPDSAYAYVLDYWKKPTAITSTNTTSTLLTAYPLLYLYACLMQSAFYTKNDKDLARYTGLYKDSLNLANGVAKAQGGPMRIITG